MKALLVLTVALSSSAGFSYTYTLTQAQKRTYWDSGRLNLVGNPQNASGVSPNDFFNSTVRSLQKWAQGSGSLVKFDYWQGTDPEEYEPNSVYNGHSSIYFASHQNTGASQIAPNVIALTQVWFDEDSGEILESDIVLNDIHYKFTMNPADTTGFGSGGPGYGSKVYLEGVITHELGHAYGLSHSGTMQSSMFFMEAPDQSHISCDDISGIRSVYANNNVNGSMAKIAGSVVAESGAPIYGANVVAVSARRGHVLGSALTDSAGKYLISGLEAGSYSLYVEPYYPGAASLPQSYAGMTNLVCSGSLFSRTFLSHSDGNSLQILHIGAGSTYMTPKLIARCNGGQGAYVGGMIGGNVIQSAPTLNFSSGHAMLLDRINTNQTQYYRVAAGSGTIEASAMSYSLFSNVRTQVDLLDSFGNEINAQVSDPVYVSETGFKNYDSKVSAFGMPEADYYVRVTSSFLASNHYPAGSTSLDSASFMVLSVRVNAAAAAQPQVFALNTRCRSNAVYSAYQSPSGDPPRGDGGGGFCASVKRVDRQSKRELALRQDFDGAKTGEILSWLAPWLFMLLSAWIARTTYRLRNTH